MQAFDYSKVKDPQYFCENRMEAHSDHVNYRDVKEMRTAMQEGADTSFRSNIAQIGELNAFEEDLTIFRAIEREDCTVKDKEAFVNGQLTIKDATVTGV